MALFWLPKKRFTKIKIHLRIGHQTFYRYGTYADENRSYTKGHSENNLRQINTFFIDFDIHTEKETISASDILTTAIDLGFMPTLIIKSDKGYQAYFVLETPVYVTSKSEFKSVKAAKIISQISENILESLCQLI